MVQPRQLQATDCRREPAWKGIGTDTKGDGLVRRGVSGTCAEADEATGRWLLIPYPRTAQRGQVAGHFWARPR